MIRSRQTTRACMAMAAVAGFLLASPAAPLAQERAPEAALAGPTETQVAEQERSGYYREPGAGAMIIDGLVVRPVSFVATIIGGAVSGSVANTDTPLGSFQTFIAYSLGMGSVIVFLTMALAAGRSGIANRMRSLLPRINRISGGLLAILRISPVLRARNHVENIFKWILFTCSFIAVLTTLGIVLWCHWSWPLGTLCCCWSSWLPCC